VTRPRWVVAIGGATLAAAVWASATPGAVRAITAPPRRPVVQQGYDDTPNFTASELLGAKFVGPRRAAQGVEGVIGYVIVGSLALLVAVCLWVTVRQLLDRTERPDLAAVDPGVDVDLEELARSVAAGAEDRLVALSAGTPAEGVVAAWTLLEASVHAAGVPLSASRTSSEVAVEVLRRFPVDDTTLRGLAELYREARWSRHPLTEDDRTRAAEAYRTLGAAVSATAPSSRGRARG
jgi:hypothetical protein